MTLSARSPELLPANGWSGYGDARALERDFVNAASALAASESRAGESVSGAPIRRFDFGTRGKPVVLLTALMHGVEVVGSLALLDVLRKLAHASDPLMARLRASAHFVALPIVNPDALATNLARLARGNRAWQRCNAHGVDLNRNFPRVTERRLYHPFSGSRFRVSPHYTGPHPLSEPEARAVHGVASETRPLLSLGFHSIGNLLLYPWAHTKLANPRVAEYRELGGVFARALRRFPYRVAQARQLYSVLGDMDDWLDAELGTLAFTVEVSRPTLSWKTLSRLLNPFCWMNPEHADPVVEDLTPGILALLSAKLGLSHA